MDCQSGCNQKNTHQATCTSDACWGCYPRLAEPGLNVCEGCFARFTTSLTIMIGLVKALASLTVTSPKSGLKERVSGSVEIGLPFNPNFLQLEAEYREWLIFVYRVIITETTVYLPPVNPLTTSITQFVKGFATWLMAHPLASDLVDDVRGFVNRFQTVVSPNDNRYITLDLTCKSEADEETCGGTLKGLIRGNKPAIIICKKDASHTQTIAELVAAAMEAHHVARTR